MLHILLVILKVIGIVIAVLLLVLLLLLSLVLWVPIRYRIEFVYDHEVKLEVKVSWLLSFVSVYFRFYEKQTNLVINLFFISIDKWKIWINKLRHLREKKAIKKHKKKGMDTNSIKHVHKKAEQEEIVSEGFNANKSSEKFTIDKKIINGTESSIEEYNGVNSIFNQNQIHNKNRTEETKKDVKKDIKKVINKDSNNDIKKIEILQEDNNSKNEKTKVTKKISRNLKKLGKKIHKTVKQFIKKIKLFFRNLKNKLHNIKYTIKRIYDKIKLAKEFISDKENQAAFLRIKKELILLLKKIMPKRFKGRLHFGTGDPATTGQVLGVISLFYPVFQNKIKISPDFEEAVMEVEFFAVGRITVFTILIILLKLYRDKNVKKIIRQFKK